MTFLMSTNDLFRSWSRSCRSTSRSEACTEGMSDDYDIWTFGDFALSNIIKINYN